MRAVAAESARYSMYRSLPNFLTNCCRDFNSDRN